MQLRFGALMLIVAAFAARLAVSGEITQAEFDKLKREVQELKQNNQKPVTSNAAERVTEEKYGPDAAVRTRSGRLTIGGLVQVWYYSIQNDNSSWYNRDGLNRHGGGVTNAAGSNEVADNDSFRIRRAELKFTMDITENVTAHVMIDPAREATSFPNLSQNQTTILPGKGIYGDIPVAFNDGQAQGGNTNNDAVRNGLGSANRLLQDAYITYHGILPHHEVSIGQMKRHLGEEGTRDSSQLDFVERAMITQAADLRDMGTEIHGFWSPKCGTFFGDNSIQYWVGMFDGAGSAFQQLQNRSDDNDNKDVVGSFLLRPIWHHETWGSLEVGASGRYGHGGESGGRVPGTTDGLDRNGHIHGNAYAWGMYKPGTVLKGWWIRGEWGMIRDRFGVGADTTTPTDQVVFTGNVATTAVADFTLQGWNVSTGYKFSDSIWGKDCGSAWWKPFEVVGRYDCMQNLFYHDLTDPSRRLDVFHTTNITAGFNYYIKNNNAKIQFNYNWVFEEHPSTGLRQIRSVRNDNFVLNFQVAW